MKFKIRSPRFYSMALLNRPRFYYIIRLNAIRIEEALFGSQSNSVFDCFGAISIPNPSPISKPSEFLFDIIIKDECGGS